MKMSKTKVLSNKEIIEIDKASREILKETGVKVSSDKALGIFKKEGCRVDYNNQLVKIPEKVLDNCLDSTPSEIKLYRRDKDDFLAIGDNLGYSAPGHNAIYNLDAKTLKRRLATKKDVSNFSKVCDALPNIHIVANGFMPQDVFPKSSILHSLEAMANNTTKHIYISPENVDETKALIDMFRVISGDKNLSKSPIATIQLSPISPLSWSKGTIEALIEVVRAGLPLSILPEPISGVTSPITLAGTLTLNNAEELSGLVLSQLVNQGCPFIYAGAWTTFNMKQGTPLIGTPEGCLLSIGGAQMAKYYRLPAHCIAFDSDSNIYDEQNGWEKIFNTIATLQSGINLVVNAGLFSTGMTTSIEQLIIDHEILTFVYRYLDGIKVDKDHIAEDVIKEVGPKKNFMTHVHTLKYIRSGEHTDCKISNRGVYDLWESRGKPSISDNASIIAKEIINDHKSPHLNKEKNERLKEIIANFEAKF